MGDAATRFWAKVNKTAACWLWTAATTSDGYGLFRLTNGVTMKLAHRVSWLLTFGAMPTQNVLHTCDTPACVNPAHLFLGTQSDNMTDCSRKGRLNSARGKRGRRAKLTEADVIAIRARRRAGELRGTLAREFSVREGSIYLICAGKTWKHL